jgi:ligand-binding sensor domain-containing protein
MLKYAFFRQFSILCLFLLITSCQGQNKSNLPKERPSEPNPISSFQKNLSFPVSDPYFVESTAITAAHGPQSITRNILQDKKGNIWLASWEGIICYDGKTFTNFTNKAGLRRFHVFSIMEDKKGNLWFGTIRAGVYRYDGKTFTNFTTSQGLANDAVVCMLEDKSGKIWFGTMDGVSCYDGKSFTNFTTKDGLVNNDVNSIIQDKSGKLWFGTRGSVCFYDGKKFTAFNNQADQPFNNVRSIIEDQQGNLWFGGQDGLCRYDGKSFTEVSKDFIGFLYADKKGKIWISAGTPEPRNMTLYRYNEQLAPLPVEKAQIEPIVKEKGQVYGVFEDKEGNIWFGTEHGGCRYDGKGVVCFGE